MDRIKENTSVKIRAAKIEDLAIANLILAENKLPVQEIENYFADNFVVAVNNHEKSVVGIAALEKYGNSGLLRSVVVAKNWRNKRIAEMLTFNRVNCAKKSGVKELYLITTTAAAYFKKFGFRIIDRNDVPDAVKQSGEFSRDCPASATVMTLTL